MLDALENNSKIVEDKSINLDEIGLTSREVMVVTVNSPVITIVKRIIHRLWKNSAAQMR